MLLRDVVMPFLLFVLFGTVMALYRTRLTSGHDKRESFVESFADQGVVERLNLQVASNIVDVFNVSLERMPSPTELRKFHDLVIDGTLNYDQIKNMMEGSGEYHRMVRTQSNLVHREIVPSMVERELELHVQELYNNVFGTTYDEADRDFLVRRYQVLGQDDPKMLKFLKTLRDSDNVAVSETFAQADDNVGDEGDEREEDGGGDEEDADSPAPAPPPLTAQSARAAVESADQRADQNNIQLMARNQLPDQLNTSKGLAFYSPPPQLDAPQKRTDSCPPNLYQVLGEGGVSMFFSNPGDNASWYVHRRNKDDIEFACTRSKKADENASELWGMLQPDLTWNIPTAPNDRLQNSKRAALQRTDTIYAVRDDTRLNGLVLQGNGDDQPALTGTLLRDVDSMTIPEFALAQRTTINSATPAAA